MLKLCCLLLCLVGAQTNDSPLYPAAIAILKTVDRFAQPVLEKMADDAYDTLNSCFHGLRYRKETIEAVKLLIVNTKISDVLIAATDKKEYDELNKHLQDVFIQNFIGTKIETENSNMLTCVEATSYLKTLLNVVFQLAPIDIFGQIKKCQGKVAGDKTKLKLVAQLMARAANCLYTQKDIIHAYFETILTQCQGSNQNDIQDLINLLGGSGMQGNEGIPENTLVKTVKGGMQGYEGIPEDAVAVKMGKGNKQAQSEVLPGMMVAVKTTKSTTGNDPMTTVVKPIQGQNQGSQMPKQSSTGRCPNQVLFVTCANKNKKSYGVLVYTTDSKATFKQTQEIKSDKRFVSLTSAPDGNRLFLNDDILIITYSRKTCSEQFNRTSSRATIDSIPITLGPTGHYILETSISTGLTRISKITDDGTLQQAVNDGAGGSKTEPRQIVFLPTDRNIYAIPYAGRNKIYFYSLSREKGTIKKLNATAEVEAGFHLQEVAFSSDGKRLYAVGNKNLIYVFGITHVKGSESIKVSPIGKPVSVAVVGAPKKDSLNLIRINRANGDVYVSSVSSNFIAHLKNTDVGLELKGTQEKLVDNLNDFDITSDGKFVAIEKGKNIVVYNVETDGSLKNKITIAAAGAEFLSYPHDQV